MTRAHQQADWAPGTAIGRRDRIGADVREPSRIDAPAVAAPAFRPATAAFFGLGYQAAAALAAFVGYGLLARDLSNEQFGIVTATLALGTWLTLLHLGQPSVMLSRGGLLPDRRPEEAAKAVTAGLAITLAASGSAMILAAIAWLAWPSATGLADFDRPGAASLSAGLAIAVAMMIPSAPAILAGFAITGGHGGALVNAVMMAANLAVAALVLAAHELDVPVSVYLALMPAAPILGGALLWWIGLSRGVLARPRLAHFDISVVRSCATAGAMFLAGELMMYAIFRTPEALALHGYGSASVAAIAPINRLSLLIFSLLVASLQPWWPAIAHASGRGDLPAARRLATRAGLVALAVGGTCALGTVVFGGPLLAFWLGRTAVAPTDLVPAVVLQSPALAAMAWSLTLFGALGMLRTQFAATALAAAVYLALANWLPAQFGAGSILTAQWIAELAVFGLLAPVTIARRLSRAGPDRTEATR